MQMKQQRGMTFLGLLVVGVVVAYAGIVLAQVAPTYIEYLSIKKAAQKSSEGSTVAEVRAIFERAAAIDTINSISGKDLEIGKSGDRVVVSFAYTREIHLAGPAFLVMKYQGESK